MHIANIRIYSHLSLSNRLTTRKKNKIITKVYPSFGRDKTIEWIQIIFVKLERKQPMSSGR